MIDFNAFHKLSYGLYIICSEFEGQKAGYAGNTAFQVTAKPSTIAISCNKDNFSCDIIDKRKAFSISVLAKDLDVSLVGTFGFQSARNINKFEKVRYKTGVTGVPVVTEACIADFECKVTGQVDVGTHMLFIGEVVYSEVLAADPVLTYDYYHSHYKMLSPKNAPTYIEPELLDKKDVAIDTSVRDEAPSEHICLICGYVYDSESGEPLYGIEPGTSFGNLPDDFECPICKAGKDFFREQ